MAFNDGAQPNNPSDWAITVMMKEKKKKKSDLLKKVTPWLEEVGLEPPAWNSGRWEKSERAG